jgi:hypothetical protein
LNYEKENKFSEMNKIIALLLFIAMHKIVLPQNVVIGTAISSEKILVAGNIKSDTINPHPIPLISNAGSVKKTN